MERSDPLDPSITSGAGCEGGSFPGEGRDIVSRRPEGGANESLDGEGVTFIIPLEMDRL